jgi:hypothetical protein
VSWKMLSPGYSPSLIGFFTVLIFRFSVDKVPVDLLSSVNTENAQILNGPTHNSKLLLVWIISVRGMFLSVYCYFLDISKEGSAYVIKYHKECKTLN